MSRKILLIVVGLLIANLVIGVALLQKPNTTPSVSNETPRPAADNDAVSLLRPFFLDEAIASEGRDARGIATIADEAGMAAYAKSPTTITLSRVTPVMTGGIEVQTADYVIGLVPLTGYTAHWNVHVLVHKNGWVMAWYHKDWPAINILDTRAATFGTSTKLSLALTAIGARIGQSFASPTYYDFAFPDATKLLMINKMRASSSTVRISLPASFLYYDKGLYADVGWWSNEDELYINNQTVFQRTGSSTRTPDAPELFTSINSNLLTDRVNSVEFEATGLDQGYEFDVFIVYSDV